MSDATPELIGRRAMWVGIVAKLVHPHAPDKATVALLAFLPMLTDLPDDAFTHRSAEAVASCDRRLSIPSYDELGRALRLWWRDHRPAQKAIGYEKPALWNEMDEVWYQYWFKRKAQNFCPVPNLVKPPGGLSWQEHVASLVRTQSGKAWSRIVAEGQA